MTRLIVASAVAPSMLPAVTPRAVADAAELAYVDLQRALEETEEAKAAKHRLKTDFDKKQKELDEKQEELKKMEEDLDKKMALMKDDAKAKAQADFQHRFVQLQETYSRL